MLRIIFRSTILSTIFLNTAFAGLYVGAGLGPEYDRYIQKSHIYDDYHNFNVTDEVQFSAAGIFGTFFAGYSWIYNWLYFAAEVNINPSSAEYQLTNQEYIHKHLSRTTFNIRYSEGLSILPGILVFKNTVIYGRLGYTNGHVKLQNSDPTIRSSTANRGGFRYGAGLRYDLENQWTIMADFSQVAYSNFSSHVYEPFGAVTKDSQIYPYAAQFTFGLIYNFDNPVVILEK